MSVPLLLPLLIAVSQTDRITLTLPSTPLPQALETIASKTGKRLTSSPALRDEVIFLHLESAPAEAALQNLARVLLAKWRTEPDGTLRLIPDDEAKRVAKRAARAEAEQTVRLSLDYLRERLAEQPASLEAKVIRKYREERAREEAERGAADGRTFGASSLAEEAPAWRAAARLAPILGLRYLAELPNEAREVWAERPTPMQRAFAPEARRVLAQYRREFALLEPAGDVARIKLAVKKWEHGGACSLEFEAFDPVGKKLDEAYVRMNADSELMKLPHSQRNQLPAVRGEQPIRLPAETVEARTILSGESKETARMALLGKWMPKLLEPTKVEPTQWHHSVELVAAAQVLKKNLIGRPSDLISAAHYKSEILTPTSVVNKHSDKFLPDSQGWILYRDSQSTFPASRRAGQDLLVSSVQLGGLTVDAASNWVAASADKWPFVSWIGDYLKVLFSGRGPYSALATMIDDRGLLLWNDLGPELRRDLKSGAVWDVRRLPPVAKTRVAEMVYWHEALEGEGDPTERLPNGISAGRVSLQILEKPVFIGWSSESGRPVTAQPVDAQTFGKYLAVGNTWFEIPRETYLSYNRYLLGVNRSYALNFVLEPGAVPMKVSLSETLFDPSAKPQERLPDAIRAEVEKVRQATPSKPVKSPVNDRIPPI